MYSVYALSRLPWPPIRVFVPTRLRLSALAAPPRAPPRATAAALSVALPILPPYQVRDYVV